MTPKTKTFLERTLSTVILLGILGGTIAWNEPIGYALLITLLCLLTTWEWFRMLAEKKQQADRPLILLGGWLYPLLLTAGMCGKLSSSTLLSFMVTYLVAFTLLAFIRQLFRMDYGGRDGATALSGTAQTLLAFVYPVWLMSFAFLGITMDEIYLVLWLVLVTKMSDIWAYVSGILMGGKFISRKFSPTVSPKKTWEGILGSLIITNLCAYPLAIWLLPGSEALLGLSPAVFSLSITPVLFVLAVWGDLAGSMIKRGLAVKDSGSLLPGIGGIFDLIDSPSFTLSFYFCMLAIIPLASL